MKSNELLQPILINLRKKYGSDLSILQGTASDSSERKKVCEMVTEMYREYWLSLHLMQVQSCGRYSLSIPEGTESWDCKGNQ